MQKKFLFALGGITVISVGLILTLTQVRSVRSGPGDRTATPSGPVTPSDVDAVVKGLPTPEVTDLAPEVATSDKLEIIIQHPNGKRDYFFLAPEMVDAFIGQLPAGDKVVDIIPPASQMGHEPPTRAP